MFDFGHVLLKKQESQQNGKGGKGGNRGQTTNRQETPVGTMGANGPASPGGMMAANNGSTLSWTSATTVNDDHMGSSFEIMPFSCLDLDYDFELPVVNLESDLKLMDKLFFNI